MAGEHSRSAASSRPSAPGAAAACGLARRVSSRLACTARCLSGRSLCLPVHPPRSCGPSPCMQPSLAQPALLWFDFVPLARAQTRDAHLGRRGGAAGEQRGQRVRGRLPPRGLGRRQQRQQAAQAARAQHRRLLRHSQARVSTLKLTAMAFASKSTVARCGSRQCTGLRAWADRALCSPHSTGS